MSCAAWMFRMTKRRAKHVGRKAMKALKKRSRAFLNIEGNESALTWEKGVAGLFDNP